MRAEYEDIIRFWFDRGVAGIRVDSVALLVKDPTFPEVGDDPSPGGHPFEDRDEVHEIYRRWRTVAGSYQDQKVLVGEVWLGDRERLARYVAPDEFHTVFGFDVMASPWQQRALREAIKETLRTYEGLGAPPSWVLGNHDVTRPATRYGRRDTSFSFASKAWGIGTDVVLGRERARAMALAMMALPGSFYIYQGEELGLDEVEDLPLDVLQDPMVVRSGGSNPGRDGCRVPMPWRAGAESLGFSGASPSAPPWLPQPPHWADLAVDVQQQHPDSTLSLYQRALRLRREVFGGHDAHVRWRSPGPDLLAFTRGSGIQCLVNMGTQEHVPPGRGQILISSDSDGARINRTVRPDTAVWWRP